MRKIALTFLILVSPFVGGPAYGQTVVDPAAQLGQVEQDILGSEAKQKQMAAEIDMAIKTQSDISNQLISLAKTLIAQEKSVQVSDFKIEKLTSDAIIIQSNLAAKQNRLSALLVGLQRLQQNPPPALMVAPEDVLQAMRGAMLFGAVVPEMRAQAQDLRVQLNKLEDIKIVTAAAKTEQAQAVSNLKSSQIQLSALLQQKKEFTVAEAQNLALEKQRAAELALQAKNIQQLIFGLAESKRLEDLKKTAEAQAREEIEKRKLLALSKPPMVLSASIGQLEYPVQGVIAKKFGDDNGLGSALDGVAITTNAGASVISPVDGKVEFSGPFRSYGQLLILNAGEGYLILLAGMKQISAEIGQSIKAGEPLGIMGDGPSSVALVGGETENAQPVLYVEFRKNSDPIDPTPWWIGGRKEAMK